MAEYLKVKRLDFEATDDKCLKLPDFVVDMYNIKAGDVLTVEKDGSDEWFIIRVKDN